MTSDWLVVIDPQAIFASPSSQWAAPRFDEAIARVHEITPSFGDRVVVTRWLPTADRTTAWGDYFRAWPFADVAPSDPLYDLVPSAAGLSAHPTIDLPTFGKWGTQLRELTGGHVTLAGVATDCCVLSTALAAADDGAWVRVDQAACAGSTDENHAAALQLMSLYSPQITVV
ncbi:MAG: cysteine hydrolase [Microbacterium sp.]